MIQLEALVDVARTEARLREERWRLAAAVGLLGQPPRRQMPHRLPHRPAPAPGVLAVAATLLRRASGALDRAAGMLDALCQPAAQCPQSPQIRHISSPTSTG
ncbi:MAG TPA: hypothetical protein VFG86_08535 [Chloroflexota bacterium]|nr:hypothetical protein [Chloroflexota bacterium]